MLLFKSFRTALLLGASLYSFAILSGAQTIKLGTLAPVGTTYHKILMTMAEAWRKESAGAIDLKIFAGGKLGGEAEMVGLMMEKNLQAAMLTAVGLAEIERAATGLQYIPMIFRNLDEVEYVGDKLRPLIEGRLAAKGFVVLFWSDVGWIQLFSNKPVKTPSDLNKLKLFAWAGDTEEVRLMKSAGFNPVPIETADIVPSLQTGLIEAVCLPPFFALASQVNVRAPYMLRLNWAPMVGACVIRKDVWEKFPPEVRDRIRATATEAGRATREAGHRESDMSVTEMEKRGLKVTTLSPAAEADWRSTFEAIYPKIRGGMVPADVYDLTIKFVQDYRAKPTP